MPSLLALSHLGLKTMTLEVPLQSTITKFSRVTVGVLNMKVLVTLAYCHHQAYLVTRSGPLRGHVNVALEFALSVKFQGSVIVVAARMTLVERNTTMSFSEVQFTMAWTSLFNSPRTSFVISHCWVESSKYRRRSEELNPHSNSSTENTKQVSFCLAIGKLPSFCGPSVLCFRILECVAICSQQKKSAFAMKWKLANDAYLCLYDFHFRRQVVL